MIDQLPVLSDLPPEIRDIVTRVILLIVALILIWIMRFVLKWALITPLQRVVRRSGRANSEAVLDAAMQPIRFIIIAVALIVSAQILDVGETIGGFVENLSRSLIIIALLMLIYRMVDLLAPSSNRLFAITGITLEERLLPFVRTAVRLAVLAVGIVIVLQEWNYDVSGLIAGIGLGGLAISLAAQDTVSNLFGFTAIVSDRPFNVGEFIITPDVTGIVENVGIRATRIRQLDQAVVYVPNSRLANSAITNWSRLSKRRMDYTLGVTYSSTSSDMRLLLHRIRELLRSQETVDPDSVQVYFVSFGESSLDILIRAYVHIADWGEFHAEQERINLEIMDIVASLGMSVAFPSRSLYVENLHDIFGGDKAADSQPRLSPRERALLHRETPAALNPVSQDAEPGEGTQEDLPDEDERG
jgi:MscS family membrane protein